MKNFSKTIAAISMSLLTVGAIAQIPANFSNFGNTSLHQAKGALVNPINAAKKVSATPQNYLIDNEFGDETIAQGFTPGVKFYYGSSLFINNAYTINDSGSTAHYIMNANNVTVVFDTLFDAFSMGYVNYIAPGLQVDSILCFVRYSNTSGKNDTIILSINSVTAQGYPSGTVYAKDTVVITPTFFAYNNLDSVQGFIARKAVVIPGTARHGWNFCVQMSTINVPKAKDSIALYYVGQGSTACGAAGGAYIAEPTYIGVPNGSVNCVNTFENGMWWYNRKGNHGNNTSLSWPITSGANQGVYENFGTYYWAPLACVDAGYKTCVGDTFQFGVQDAAIDVYVDAVSTDGISTISNSGLSVAQNYPNPFNKETTINYSLTKSSTVTFTVYDITGRVITNNNYGNVAPGQHQVNLNANTFSPGVYFYTFNVNGSIVTKKMVITE